MITTEAVIIVVFLSVCFAAFYAYYNKKILGDFIRKLVSEGALSSEQAKKLSELGYNKKMAFLVSLGIGKNSSIRRFVVPKEEEPEKKTNEDGVSFKIEKKSEQSYFVLSEKKEDALKRYDKRGMSLGALVVCIVIAFAAMLVALFAVPYISYIMSDVYGGSDVGYETEYEINDTITDDQETENDTSDDEEESSESEAQENSSRFEIA